MALNVLILGSDYNSYNVARCLATVPSVSIHVLDTSREFPLGKSRHVKSFHTWSECPGVATSEANWKAIVDTAERLRPQVVLPVNESEVRIFSKRGIALTDCRFVPVPPLESLDLVVDKQRFAEFMVRHDLSHPRTADLSSIEQISNMAFPILAKPARSSGGKGIEFLADRHELDRFLQLPFLSEQNYVFQEFIEGDDVSCNVLCQNGEVMASTIQRGILPSPTRFAPSLALEFIKDRVLLSLISDMMQLLRWNGVANIDLRYSHRDASYRVLEINPRYWGSLLASQAMGVNFPYLSCLAAMEIPFKSPDYRTGKFYNGRIWSTKFIRQWLRGDRPTFAYRETKLPFLLADPWPAIIARVRRQ